MSLTYVSHNEAPAAERIRRARARAQAEQERMEAECVQETTRIRGFRDVVFEDVGVESNG